MRAKLVVSVALAVVISIPISGCAVVKKKHRHVANLLDENLTPEDRASKVALAPIAIPVGLAALLVDGAAINPVLNLPKAVDDAGNVFTKIDSAGPGEIVVFPMRVVTFVVFFVGSEVGRCALPID